MKYFFILGSNSDLSFAELQAVFKSYSKDNKFNLYRLNSKVAILKNHSFTQEDIINIFEMLGGSVRAGEIIKNQDKFLDKFKDNSITFGITLYQNPDIETEVHQSQIKELAKKIKDFYRKKDMSCRYIIPNETELNTVRVADNQLLTEGFELVLMEDNEHNIITGRTLIIQNFENFSQRDFERPKVDTEMGVLPPKLARIMINLSETKPNDIIWDPFCGSGTILLEALILNRNVLGSDVNQKAVNDTEKNIKWLAKNYNLTELEYNTFKLDIHKTDYKIARKLKKTDIKAIICEPYMGPPQKRILPIKKAEKISKIVIKQYRSLFDFLKGIGKNNLTVVIVVPSYKTKKGWLTISMNDLLSHRWNCVNPRYQGYLHWKRKTSIIKRNILIFKLKKY